MADLADFGEYDYDDEDGRVFLGLLQGPLAAEGMYS